MFFHYIKIAWRNLARHRVLTFINVSGLSVGLACFSLFLLYAVHELSYDRFHEQSAGLYRVYDWWDYEGRSGREPSATTPLGPALKSDLADVEDFVRMQGGFERLVRAGNQVNRIRISFADPQFFSLFTFPLLEGDAATALADPHSVVLTEARALQLFGKTDVVGETVEIQNNGIYEPFIVSGVANDIPTNSTITFDILGNFGYILASPDGQASMGDWHMTIGVSTYVKLKPNSDLMHEPERLALFRQKYFVDEGKRLQERGVWKGKGKLPVGYGLQPIADMHTNVTIDPWGASNTRNIWILVGISAGVLAIACINFIILAIGRSAGRSREVGVRKVIGGRRLQLIYQFLAESLLLSFFSAIIGYGLAEALLPFFNVLSGRSLTFSFRQYPELALLLSGTVVASGLLAGSYPALVLSGFRPVEALKNRIRLAGSNLFTRSLVTFQFGISAALILVTVVILQQLSYMHTRDLGLNQENVVAVRADGTDTEKIYPLFRTALQGNASILGVTGSAIGLGANEWQMGHGFKINDKVVGVIEYPVDHRYIDVMGMRLIAGRDFNADAASDTMNAVIVNEALVRNDLNTTPEKALDMQLRAAKGNKVVTIIGVVRDFNFESLTRKVRSQFFTQPPSFSPAVFYVRLKSGDPTESIALLERTWKSLAPDVPFSYSFLDEKFDAFYTSEQRWSRIVGWGGGISIFLACLGLFGLASLAVANRTKEMGIRKVLGASVASVTLLLSKDFVKLVLIALVLAAPVAWFVLEEWLKTFAYRISLQVWVFVLAGAAVLAVALFTVGLQSIRAAFMNPVDSLKTE